MSDLGRRRAKTSAAQATVPHGEDEGGVKGGRSKRNVRSDWRLAFGFSTERAKEHVQAERKHHDDQQKFRVVVDEMWRERARRSPQG